jgi:hypothetical protein
MTRWLTKKNGGAMACNVERTVKLIVLLVWSLPHCSHGFILLSTTAPMMESVASSTETLDGSIFSSIVTATSFPLLQRQQQPQWSPLSSMADLSLWNSMMLLSNNNPPPQQEDLRISSNSNNNKDNNMLLSKSNLKWERDQVVRVMDPNTIRLKQRGLVTMAAVRTPLPGFSNINFQYPDCFTYDPAYKITQLLPAQTDVLVYVIPPPPAESSSSTSSSSDFSSSSTTTTTTPIAVAPAAILIRQEDQVMVNRELVRTGFARIRRPNPAVEEVLPRAELVSLQAVAQSKGLGLYVRCNKDDNDVKEATNDRNVIVQAEFEPIVRRQSDRVVAAAAVSSKDPPSNPGDIKGRNVFRAIFSLCQFGYALTRIDMLFWFAYDFQQMVLPARFLFFMSSLWVSAPGCSDFATYEDALRWFETYRPWYGDVARLDRNGDGIPCPALPHTAVQDQYRMKIPTARKVLPLPLSSSD